MSAPRFWNIASVGEDGAELTLYGEIVTRRPYNWIIDAPDDGLWITPEDFLRELDAVRSKATLTIRINSVGGDLYTSLGIFTQLKELAAKKTVIIDGIAASAASVIAMAGDVIQIPPGGSIMIHEAAMTLAGVYQHNDVKLIERRLEAANDMAAQTYHAKTGIAVDAIRSLMAKETWLTGQDAVNRKFADEVIHGAAAPSMSLSADKKNLTVNGVTFSTAGLHNIPESVPVLRSRTAKPANKTNKSGGKPIVRGKVKATMKAFVVECPECGVSFEVETDVESGTVTVECPECGAEFEVDVVGDESGSEDKAAARGKKTSAKASAAVLRERRRIKAIDAIAPAIGDAELIASAKFGDKTMTAEQLALAAMRKQAKQGAEFQNNAAKDYAVSGANGVKPTGTAATGAETPLTSAQRMAQGLANGRKLRNDGGNNNA